MTDITDISAALAEARAALLGRANVVATGVGFKVTEEGRTPTLSIVCSVVEKLPLAALSARDVVPQTVSGVPTDVVATGVIRALGSVEGLAPTGRFRPAPGGVSIAHKDVTAGTLGCLVRRDEEVLILSNNHVLANSNAAAPGDAILQPGPVDGGRDPEDRIAVLDTFVPVMLAGGESSCALARAAASVANGVARLFGSSARLQAVSTRTAENLVDAALARPLDAGFVSANLFGVGPIAGVSRAELGAAITKSGRTTGVTSGEILQVDVTADVRYGQNVVARFTDQVMAGAMSAGGDSGSAIINGDRNLVGLLFAGSEQSTVINRIEHVFAALSVGL